MFKSPLAAHGARHSLAGPLQRSPIATAVPPLRVLIVAPEVASLPAGLSRWAGELAAKAGGLADVAASLVRGLDRPGIEVHFALPNYRTIFGVDAAGAFKRSLAEAGRSAGHCRLHLAEDRAFYYRTHIYGGPEAHLAAAAFQREVIHTVIPRVDPDLIHCHDWMTGLVPGYARQHGIPCLFTVHNVHTDRRTLAFYEDRGIDTASFWKQLYYDRAPASYEETRWGNPCDALASGIHAADHVNVVSPNFLNEVVHGFHDDVHEAVRSVLRGKAEKGAASGIVNAPPSSYDPVIDPDLPYRYAPADFEEGKALNKLALQDALGLEIDPAAPVLFWPSRLDPVQKGCQLLTEVLHRIVSDYDELGLQVVAIADGPFQCHLHEIVRLHGFDERVACVGFEESLSRLAYAGADFVLMPSLFEPCGLPQMIGARYGTLPIVRNTGGLHDTVAPLDADAHRGNGFLFDHYDSEGFRWAIDMALAFFRRPAAERHAEIRRVMQEAAATFSEDVMLARYIALYEQILQRPLLSTPGHPTRTLTAPLPVTEAMPAARPVQSEEGQGREEPARPLKLAPLEAMKTSECA